MKIGHALIKYHIQYVEMFISRVTSFNSHPFQSLARKLWELGTSVYHHVGVWQNDNDVNSWGPEFSWQSNITADAIFKFSQWIFSAKFENKNYWILGNLLYRVIMSVFCMYSYIFDAVFFILSVV